jgi:hypothetical protein
MAAEGINTHRREKLFGRYSEANRRTVKHEMGNRREIIVQYYESLRPGITILRHSQTTA